MERRTPFPDEDPVVRTLFLHPPSFDGFDGGAGARYQMTREVRSFWYPTWLAQPAALVSGVEQPAQVFVGVACLRAEDGVGLLGDPADLPVRPAGGRRRLGAVGCCRRTADRADRLRSPGRAAGLPG